ncbi:ribonuclease HII [Kocuria sp. CNJ-770]|uniref:ribonuclease HII n=1 Tax=Kocuria sp. CNJ-770 TaxID=1904964 RepID=UPI0009658B42|nr:ribonuclease HII [Kocuria sp. CNJ-770]OLT08698.1 ribonuclease HII [Kocuria sp. CNJ-770]
MAPEPRTARPPAAHPGRAPGLAVERSLQEAGAHRVGGMDEVGRGALAGPVTAGVVVLRPGTARGIPGLRDSKLLSPARREALVPRIRSWCAASGVGHASPQEIDRLGLTAALHLAGQRALAAATRGGAAPDVVLLDGRHDWLTADAAPSLFDPAAADEPLWTGTVVTRVKADLTCASVAAASVLAKVERDRIMRELSGDWPQYGWESNKGYGAAGHRAALEEGGPTPHHRLSWRLTRPATAAGPSTSGDETT